MNCRSYTTCSSASTVRHMTHCCMTAPITASANALSVLSGHCPESHVHDNAWIIWFPIDNGTDTLDVYKRLLNPYNNYSGLNPLIAHRDFYNPETIAADWSRCLPVNNPESKQIERNVRDVVYACQRHPLCQRWVHGRPDPHHQASACRRLHLRSRCRAADGKGRNVRRRPAHCV